MGYVESVLGYSPTESVEKPYNGWSTYETWLFNVHDDGSMFDDYTQQAWTDIQKTSEDYETEEKAVKELLDRVADYAKEEISELFDIDKERNALKRDFLGIAKKCQEGIDQILFEIEKSTNLYDDLDTKSSKVFKDILTPFENKIFELMKYFLSQINLPEKYDFNNNNVFTVIRSDLKSDRITDFASDVHAAKTYPGDLYRYILEIMMDNSNKK